MIHQCKLYNTFYLSTKYMRLNQTSNRHFDGGMCVMKGSFRNIMIAMFTTVCRRFFLELWIAVEGEETVSEADGSYPCPDILQV